MHAFFAYLYAHPSLWVLGWPILTALVTALFKETTIARLPKPLAWLIHFMKGTGVDSKMVLLLLRILLGRLSLQEGFPLVFGSPSMPSEDKPELTSSRAEGKPPTDAEPPLV